MVDDLRDKLGSGVVLLAAETDGRAHLPGARRDQGPQPSASRPATWCARCRPWSWAARAAAAPTSPRRAAGPEQLDAAFERLYELVAGD